MPDFNKWLSELTRSLRDDGHELTPQGHEKQPLGELEFDIEDDPFGLEDLDLEGTSEHTSPTPPGNHSHQLRGKTAQQAVSDLHELDPDHDLEIDHQLYRPLGCGKTQCLYPDVVGMEQYIFDEYFTVDETPIILNTSLAGAIWKFMHARGGGRTARALERYKVAITDQYGWYMSEPTKAVDGLGRCQVFRDGPAAFITIIDAYKGIEGGKGDCAVARIPIASARVLGHVELAKMCRGDELALDIITETCQLNPGKRENLDKGFDVDEIPF